MWGISIFSPLHSCDLSVCGFLLHQPADTDQNLQPTHHADPELAVSNPTLSMLHGGSHRLLRMVLLPLARDLLSKAGADDEALVRLLRERVSDC
jgi:hypothetical protein